MSLPNGEVVQLRAGQYEASVAASGATLGSVQFQGRDMVVPVDLTADLPIAYQGKTLVPWPNRIVDGVYEFQGTRYEVPVNEHVTGAALHGLGCWQEWRIEEHTEDSVVFSLHLLPSYGYPGELRITSAFRLDAKEGLTAQIRAENVGTSDAPYGVSSHPYLTVGGTIDDCVLTIPAARMLTVDENLGPKDVVDVVDVDTDFRGGRRVGSQFVDNAFTALPEGPWEVRLERPGDMAVVMSAQAPWVQFYSGEHLGRRGAAIEPMTCAPDAFNSGDRVIVLAPGDSHTFTWSVRGIL